MDDDWGVPPGFSPVLGHRPFKMKRPLLRSRDLVPLDSAGGEKRRDQKCNPVDVDVENEQIMDFITRKVE